MRTEKNSKDTVKILLLTRKRWVIISHIKPDGDTLGSASALVQMAIDLGKDVRWWGQDPFPERYNFLPRSELYTIKNGIFDGDIDEDSVLISVDVSSLDRGIKGMESAELAVIDHHGDNSLSGSVKWVDGKVSSVGEMIYTLSQSIGIKLTKGIAEAIYVAIITDTGNLSFSNVTGSTVRAIADLIDVGVDPSLMSERLYHRDTPERLHLWARAFERVKWINNICYSYLYAKDFCETGTDHDDTESLVNSLMRIRNTEVALLFVEDDGDVKVSLRSKGNISVQAVAHIWGGGGHVCASGCRVKGKMDEVIADVVKSIPSC